MLRNIPGSFADEVEAVLTSAPGLQRREGQLAMAKLVAQVLTHQRPERCAAVEAGTGTGKSLAYLVPVMLYAARTGQRAVVATATRSLQDQIAKKDAPQAAGLVGALTGKTVSFAVLYGKGNYLCPELLERRLADLAGALSAERRYLERLAAWLQDGGSGLKDDVPQFADLPAVEDQWWERVSAADDAAECGDCGRACAFSAARSAAARAHVVVANHHLVAADYLLRQKAAGLSLFADKGERPPETLVIDEAHRFLDALRGAFEVSFTPRRVKRLRDDVLRFLDDMAGWADGNGYEFEAGYIRELAKQARGFAESSTPDREVSELFAVFDKRLMEGERDAVLVHPGSAPRAQAEAALEAVGHFFSPTSGLLAFAARAVEALDAAVGNDREPRREADRLVRRFGRLKERAAELATAVRRAALAENHYRLSGPGGDACWYERGRFVAMPVDVSSEAGGLWALYDHVVFTSATLYPFPQSDGFPWFRAAYGLDEGEVVHGIVPSPFNYAEQMRAVVLTHPALVPANGSGEAARERAARRVEKLAEAVIRAVEATEGGVLVLFTSYREMRGVAALVRGRLPTDRPLFVQGEAGRAELLARFKEHGRAVLLGVASFWEGVDVAGDALSTLVIAKLPFPAPDDPLVEALKWLAGEDWWGRVCRPLAALALRQGVGRLIRTETDTGLVVVCDPRAAGQHRRFVLACLPVVPKECETL